MKTTFLCNKCGMDFTAAPMERKEGDLDIIYITCPHCNEEYLVSVTDSILREAIESYKKLAGRMREVTDAETSAELVEAARKMKEQNLVRCRQLMDDYSRNFNGNSFSKG